MKKLFTVLILLIGFNIGFSQAVYDYGVSWLFQRDSHTWADSVKYEADSLYWYMVSDTTADTITSNPVYVTPQHTSWGNSWITGRLISDSAHSAASVDTINTVIQVGLYTGEGYPDYTGIDWHNLITCTSDSIFSISLVDSAWFSDYAASRRYYRILETTKQKNKYVLWVHELREK